MKKVSYFKVWFIFYFIIWFVYSFAIWEFYNPIDLLRLLPNLDVADRLGVLVIILIIQFLVFATKTFIDEIKTKVKTK